MYTVLHTRAVFAFTNTDSLHLKPCINGLCLGAVLYLHVMDTVYMRYHGSGLSITLMILKIDTNNREELDALTGGKESKRLQTRSRVETYTSLHIKLMPMPFYFQISALPHLLSTPAPKHSVV